MQALVFLLAATFVATFLAQQLAIAKHRSTRAWMWTSALFPPAVLALAVAPRRTGKAGGDA